MADYTREQLYNGTTSSMDLGAGYDMVLDNDASSQIYFTVESLTNTPIFDNATIDQNSPYFVSESQHVTFIIPPNSTVEFGLSFGGINIPREEIRFLATNGHTYNINDRTSSGSYFGVGLRMVGA